MSADQRKRSSRSPWTAPSSSSPGAGVADTKRDRPIIWGGGHNGHNDYYGNEIYALDLRAGQLQRLNDPTALTAHTACSGILAEGKPASRHTYGGLSYLAREDEMIVLGGAPSRVVQSPLTSGA